MVDVDIGDAKSINMEEAISESGGNRFCTTSERTGRQEGRAHIVARGHACTGIDRIDCPGNHCANWAAF